MKSHGSTRRAIVQGGGAFLAAAAIGVPGAVAAGKPPASVRNVKRSFLMSLEPWSIGEQASRAKPKGS